MFSAEPLLAPLYVLVEASRKCCSFGSRSVVELTTTTAVSVIAASARANAVSNFFTRLLRSASPHRSPESKQPSPRLYISAASQQPVRQVPLPLTGTVWLSAGSPVQVASLGLKRLNVIV